MTDDVSRWWVLHESQLRSALERAHQGDNPDIVLLELTANADVETVEPDCD